MNQQNNINQSGSINNSNIHSLLQNSQVNCLVRDNFVKVTFKNPQKHQNMKLKCLYHEEDESFLYFFISWLFLLDNMKNKLRQAIQKKIFILDTMIVLLYLIGFITNIIQDQLYFDFDTVKSNGKITIIIKGNPTTQIQIIRAVTTFTTIIILILIPFYYKINHFLLIMRCEIDYNEKYWSWYTIFEFVLTYIITIFHVPPYFDEFYISIKTMDENPIKIKVNLILFLNVLITLRCFFVFVYFSRYSSFSNDRADKVCEESNVKNNVFFTLKSLLKDKPIISIVLLFTVSIFIFGYMLRNTELAFIVDVEQNKFQNWTNIWNGFWCITMAFFTIGYGDFYPQTVVGRMVLCLALIWGMFLVGLLILHFSTWFVLSPKEKKVYNETLNEFEIRKKKALALKLIVAYYKAEIYLEKVECRKNKELLNKLMKQVVKFKKKRKINENDSDKIRIGNLLEQMNYLNDREADEMLTNLQNEVEDTNKKIKKAKINQFKIKRYLDTIYKLTKNLHTCIGNDKK